MERVCDKLKPVSAHRHSWEYWVKLSKLTEAGISFSAVAASFLRFVSLG
jgi:hypothetical protein